MSRLAKVCTRGLALLFAATACARPLQMLRVDGSAGVAPLVEALATAYRARHPDAPVSLASGMGSAARLRAVEEGRIEIAMASHGVDSADVHRRGLTTRTIARTAVVFAVHAGVPLTSLTSAQACDVFGGRARSWRDPGGPDVAIVALMRPRGEVDADVALAGVPCFAALTLAPDVRLIERPDDMARATRRFLEFVASEDGARTIRANGAVPAR